MSHDCYQFIFTLKKCVCFPMLQSKSYALLRSVKFVIKIYNFDVLYAKKKAI